MALIGLRLVSGTVGSGKSYYMAEIILQALKEGAQVHTNLDLIDEEIDKRGYRSQIVDLRQVDVRDMKDHIRAGDEKFPNILALDETALHFNVDEQNEVDIKKKNKAVFEFLAWSRRYGLEIYFATQARANINVKLRRMSEYTIRCQNMDQTPYFGWLFVALGRDFKRDQYLTDEDKEIYLTTEYAKFSKVVGSFYDTHGFCGLQDKQGIVLNKVVTRRAPLRKDQRKGKIALALFALAICGAGYYLQHSLRYFLNPPDVVAQADSPIDSSPAAVVSVPLAPERIQFLARSPRLVVMTESGLVYARGEIIAGQSITNMAELGNTVLVTFDNNQTKQLNR